MKTFSSYFSTALVLAMAIAVYPKPSTAGTASGLKIGDTYTLIYGSRTAPKNPLIVGEYHVKNGVSGVLYFVGEITEMQNSSDFWGYRYRFFDVSGKERCRGTLDQGQKRADLVAAPEFYFQTWRIESAVPGSKCSTAGKTFYLKKMVN